MAQPYATFNFLDHSGEKSKLSVYLPDVTPANFDDMVSDLDGLKVAIAALSLCNLGAVAELVSESHTDVATIPTDPYAQRERRAIFSCIDSVTGRKFTIGVPAPDLDDMAISGTDAINMGNLEVAAYVTALGTFALSPEGNAFAVIKGRVTGVPS